MELRSQYCGCAVRPDPRRHPSLKKANFSVGSGRSLSLSAPPQKSNVTDCSFSLSLSPSPSLHFFFANPPPRPCRPPRVFGPPHRRISLASGNAAVPRRRLLPPAPPPRSDLGAPRSVLARARPLIPEQLAAGTPGVLKS